MTDFVWFRRKHQIESDKIVPVISEKPEAYAPLSEPDLLFSFAKLASRGKPSDRRVLRWADKYGLLDQDSEKHPDGRAKYPTKRNPNQRPVSPEELAREAKQANSVLNLYTDLRRGDHKKLEGRLRKVSEGQEEWKGVIQLEDERNRDMDDWLLEGSGFKSNGRVSSGFLDFGARIIFEYSLQVRLERIRLTVQSSFGNAYQSFASWECPDLYSAVYLHLFLLATDKAPVERCKIPTCQMPFELKPKHKKFCSATCRSNARHYPELKESSRRDDTNADTNQSNTE
jgi:hypothetical protein